jgi:2-polyprenyl-3-methyl-5-hydroxy-6-metoxy-1,4-benzoquinol methylase
VEVPELLDVWEQVYTTKPSNEVSWFQPEPVTSLRLIETFATGPAASVIDVGGGTSSLVDRLLEADFADVTVLDVSQHALTEVRERLGARGRHATFLQRDLLTWIPDREYEVWHDRAVFHFLTEPSARDHYVENTEHGVGAGGVLVLGTFAEDGPTECSGLPVTRYSPKDLGAVFSPSFSMVHQQREEHVTPAGIIQPFTWVVLRRA